LVDEKSQIQELDPTPAGAASKKGRRAPIPLARALRNQHVIIPDLRLGASKCGGRNLSLRDGNFELFAGASKEKGAGSSAVQMFPQNTSRFSPRSKVSQFWTFNVACAITCFLTRAPPFIAERLQSLVHPGAPFTGDSFVPNARP
jgi:hypothetical protein